MRTHHSFRFVLLASLLFAAPEADAQAPAAPPPAAQPPSAGAVLESSYETRFQLDLQAPTAAVSSYLPPGWTLNVSTTAGTKDVNLRILLVDRITINAADGKPVGKGSNRVVYLAIPAKDAAGTNTQLVIGGLTEDPADAPGPFGNYLAATTHTMQRSTSVPASGSAPVIESQDWNFTAVTGEHIEVHLKYEKGVANRGNPNEAKLYSAKDPKVFQTARQEQILDVVRNVNTNPPDRVKEFTLNASGGSFAKLFDGTQKVLSWDNIPWVSRVILRP